MKAEEVQSLELFLQGLRIIKKEFAQKVNALAEEVEALLPEEPLHVDRDYVAELDEIYREKCRGKS